MWEQTKKTEQSNKQMLNINIKNHTENTNKYSYF